MALCPHTAPLTLPSADYGDGLETEVIFGVLCHNDNVTFLSLYLHLAIMAVFT